MQRPMQRSYTFRGHLLIEVGFSAEAQVKPDTVLILRARTHGQYSKKLDEWLEGPAGHISSALIHSAELMNDKFLLLPQLEKRQELVDVVLHHLCQFLSFQV